MTRVPGRGLGQIKFDGLMIGRYDRDQRIYQLGVLPAEGHKFTICYQIDGPRRVSATSVTLPEERGIWRLGIANREPDTDSTTAKLKPTGTIRQMTRPHCLFRHTRGSGFKGLNRNRG